MVYVQVGVDISKLVTCTQRRSFRLVGANGCRYFVQRGVETCDDIDDTGLRIRTINSTAAAFNNLDTFDLLQRN